MYTINKGKNPSGRDKLNILYKEKNVYIMDNHLAAIWCWYQQLDLSNEYSFLHIDRHDDLGDSLIKEGKSLLKKEKINIKNILAENITDYKVNNVNIGMTQLFVWDNYINFFRLLNPKTIKETIFSTQEDGIFLYPKKSIIHKESWDLQNELSYYLGEKDKFTKKWIVNLDIDYFFAVYNDIEGNKEIIYQYLTDGVVRSICRQIKDVLDSSVAILTIAMSPECCGGWDESIRLTNLVAKELGLKFRYK